MSRLEIFDPLHDAGLQLALAILAPDLLSRTGWSDAGKLISWAGKVTLESRRLDPRGHIITHATASHNIHGAQEKIKDISSIALPVPMDQETARLGDAAIRAVIEYREANCAAIIENDTSNTSILMCAPSDDSTRDGKEDEGSGNGQ